MDFLSQISNMSLNSIKKKDIFDLGFDFIINGWFKFVMNLGVELIWNFRSELVNYLGFDDGLEFIVYHWVDFIVYHWVDFTFDLWLELILNLRVKLITDFWLDFVYYLGHCALWDCDDWVKVDGWNTSDILGLYLDGWIRQVHSDLRFFGIVCILQLLYNSFKSFSYVHVYSFT